MTDPTDRKRATATSFGAAADSYLDSDVHREGADLDRLASWCCGATRALDVATGAGHTAGAIAEEGVPRVIAADAAPEMVAPAVSEFGGMTAAESGDLDGVVADAERLPFVDGSFDAVSCRIAAHHFPEPERFVDEVARVLAPGGTLAFEDNVAPDDGELGAFINRVDEIRDPTHVEAYTTDQWRDWMDERGLVVEETVHLKKTLAFEPWVEAQSLPPEERDRVEGLLLDARGDAAEFFEIRVEAGSVQSFANLKALIRAHNRGDPER